MAITLNGDGTITGVSAGGLPDDSIIQADIADASIDEARLQISNSPTNGYMLTAQSGDTGGLTWAAAGGGKVLNIWNAEKLDVFSSNATSATAVTGLTVTTGTLTSGSKVLVTVVINVSNDNAEQRTHVTTWSGATQLFLGDAGASAHRVSAFSRLGGTYEIMPISYTFLHDTSGATTAQTYAIKIHTTSTSFTGWVNKSAGEDANSGRTPSSITAMEIGA